MGSESVTKLSLYDVVLSATNTWFDTDDRFPPGFIYNLLNEDDNQGCLNELTV